MQKYIIGLLLLAHLMVHADIKGKVSTVTGKPLANTHICWLNTNECTSTDVNGHFFLKSNASTNQLIVSHIAYESDTLTIDNNAAELNIQLQNAHVLSDVQVSARHVGTFKQRSTMFNTEKITIAELYKAACCNLSESFETNPSVDVNYSDAATGAKHIKMLGLPGVYVQMLTENIPNLRGIATPYGLGYIPGPWMESIQVSKGTSSVITGYEATTGQINVEYKKPATSEKLFFNLFANDAGRIETNVNAGIIVNPKLSTGLLLHASDELNKLDKNNDNFIDMPMVRQYNFINRWLYTSNKYSAKAFVRVLDEKRTGGQVNGNYKIGIDTRRYEFFVKSGYILDSSKRNSIALIISGSNHEQQAKYGTKYYDGKQTSLYSNLIYQNSWNEKHKLTAGFNLSADRFNERLFDNQEVSRLINEVVGGSYAEYSLQPTEKITLLTGLRYDYNSIYGALFTPRFHLKITPSEKLMFRINAGKAYRSPHILAEYNYLLAGNRDLIISDNINMENAWNFGISNTTDFQIGSKNLELNAEYYYTNFKEQLVADMDSDPHKVFFQNLNGKSFSHSAQFELKSEIVTGLTVNVAHRINVVKTTIGGKLRDKPLTNRSKSLVTLSYQSPLKKWQFDYTAQFNGGGRLPDPSATNPHWPTTFDPFIVMNSQITRYFRTWSVYAGVENMTNFMQMHPIINVENPESPHFDASMIWGPLHGRKLYAGLRWAITRD